MTATLSYLLCALLIILSSVSCSARSNPQKQKQALFVFGDSLFDAGNNQYLNGSQKEATTWPYGETYFKHPTGRLSDGRLVPDLIAQFANLPILPAYLKPGAHDFTVGANFASGGSGVLSGTNFARVINLPTQLSHFKDVVKTLNKQLGDVEAKKLLNNAVYLFSAGGNDYFGLYRQNPNATQSYKAQYIKMVVGNLTNTLTEIYNLGGRKIAFQNAGSLGCVPINRASNARAGGGCVEVLSALARQHNRYLPVALKKLESTLPGFKYSIFDYYNAIEERVNKPSKYGLKESKSACCGSGDYRASGCGAENRTSFELCSNPAEYLWFDGGHTTEAANLQLANLMWNGPPNVTGPRTVKQLFGYM